MNLTLNDVPYLGMGTWKMGGAWDRDDSHDGESIAALTYGLSLGYRIIDTAEMYGAGHTETLVGNAIKSMPREQLYVVSKVWHEHLSYDATLRAAEQSLERLDTDYIDLYLIHWPDDMSPLSETFRAFQHLSHDGKIRHVGVSNFDLKRTQEALRISPLPITAIQIEYNVFNRDAEKDLVPFCRTHDIAVMAYRPLGKGVTEFPRPVVEISRERGATPSQIALSWLTSQGMYAIPKALNHAHIRENWQSQEFPLTSNEIERIRNNV